MGVEGIGLGVEAPAGEVVGGFSEAGSAATDAARTRRRISPKPRRKPTRDASQEPSQMGGTEAVGGDWQASGPLRPHPPIGRRLPLWSVISLSHAAMNVNLSVTRRHPRCPSAEELRERVTPLSSSRFSWNRSPVLPHDAPIAEDLLG